MFTRISSLLILISFPLFTLAQTPVEKGLGAIDEAGVEAQLEFLSSDWMEGRATGTRGEYMAGDYIASMFKVYGLEPAGDMVNQRFSRREIDQGKKNKTYQSYFQNFQLIEFSPSEEQFLSLISREKNSVSEMEFAYRTDFAVYPGPVSQSGKAGVVFAGYGLKQEDKDYYDF